MSEKIVGRALKEYARREKIVVATKVCSPMGQGPNDHGLSRKHIFHAIDDSLKRLGTDYMDLYQIHRWDYETPIEETLEAMNDLVRMGKVRYIGASSMHCWQFAKALFSSDIHRWYRFVSMQPQYNLLYREEEREMIPFCIDQKIAIISWSPLARGFLSKTIKEKTEATKRESADKLRKKYFSSENDYEILKRVNEIAQNRKISPAQVALAWILSKSYITSVIVGITKKQYLDDANAALLVSLTTDEITQLEELYQQRTILGFS